MEGNDSPSHRGGRRLGDSFDTIDQPRPAGCWQSARATVAVGFQWAEVNFIDCRRHGIGLKTRRQEHIPREQRGALLTPLAPQLGADILNTVVTTKPGEPEVRGESGQDSSGRDLAISGISENRGTQGFNAMFAQAGVRDVATSLILEKDHTGLGVEEPGKACDIDRIETKETGTNLVRRPSRLAHKGGNAAIRSPAILEKSLKVFAVTAPYPRASTQANRHARKGRTCRKVTGNDE
jgi:hypothetical protein